MRSDYIENIENNIENNIDLKEKEFNKRQEFMLESKMGQVLNSCLDAGIKAICPSLIDNEIIEIKDAIIENGLEGGIKEVVSSIKEYGKSTLGLITGNFENISQIEMAVKRGGIIDTLSDVLDVAINSATKNCSITKDVANLLKKGKNAMIKDFSKSFSNELLKEQKTLEKIEELVNEWKEKYNEKDLEGMEKIYKKIERQNKKVIPIKNIVESTQNIENLHNLIKNNNGEFNLSEEELELAQKL